MRQMAHKQFKHKKFLDLKVDASGVNKFWVINMSIKYLCVSFPTAPQCFEARLKQDSFNQKVKNSKGHKFIKIRLMFKV